MLTVVMAFMAVSVAAGGDIKCDGYWCYIANSGINRIIAHSTNFVAERCYSELGGGSFMQMRCFDGGGIDRLIESGTDYVEGRGWHVIPAREE